MDCDWSVRRKFFVSGRSRRARKKKLRGSVKFGASKKRPGGSGAESGRGAEHAPRRRRRRFRRDAVVGDDERGDGQSRIAERRVERRVGSSRDRSRDASKKDFVRTKRKSGLPRPPGTHRLARGPRCFRETFESAFLCRAVRLRSRRWMGSGARGKGQIRVFVSSSVSKRRDGRGRVTIRKRAMS